MASVVKKEAESNAVWWVPLGKSGRRLRLSHRFLVHFLYQVFFLIA